MSGIDGQKSKNVPFERLEGFSECARILSFFLGWPEAKGQLNLDKLVSWKTGVVSLVVLVGDEEGTIVRIETVKIDVDEDHSFGGEGRKKGEVVVLHPVKDIRHALPSSRKDWL
jgi:hypothetical protein